MGKKLIAVLLALGISTAAAFVGFGIWHSAANATDFEMDGYILVGGTDEVKYTDFYAGDTYKSTLKGQISFKGADGKKAAVDRESFVHYNDGSIMALSGGVLLDFNDISDNFINNYYINQGLVVTASGSTYTAETTAGTMEFGENLWKLSDTRYIVQSPSVKVHFSDADVREVTDYVQVDISSDGILRLLTPENLWMTISPDCYLETAGGVRIYPLSDIIESGEFKMSAGKLSVNADDAIVLSSNETRRQIVPKLNIEGIDGLDGDDGATGNAGAGGAAGTAGSKGSRGGTGESGEIGGDGGTGGTGGDGADGEKGGDGSTGSTGKNGNVGSGGSTGPAAVVESSINSALPTMSITEWKVTATGLRGAILVNDKAGYMGKMSEAIASQSYYAGKVTITEVDTGKVIQCYQASSIDGDGNGSNFTDCYKGDGTTFYFRSDNGTGTPGGLNPDTKYKLSVVAYYNASVDETSSNANLIYSREFISRTFYTDSSGVTLEYQSASTDSVTVGANVALSQKDSIQNMVVYLLTPEQNKTFSGTSGSSNYVARVAKQYGEIENRNQITFKSTEEHPISSNTDYVVRVFVESETGLNQLTTEELPVKTLKRAPVVVDEEEQPNASYNRTTNAFDVFRPKVNDPDNAVTRYIYYVKVNGTIDNSLTRTVYPSQGEPYSYQGLEPGKSYDFIVDMEFDDNEKTVVRNLGETGNLSFEGEAMPRLSLQIDGQGQEYNMLTGKLTVTLAGENSRYVIDTDHHPLQLELYTNQSVASKVVELTTPLQPVNVLTTERDEMGTMTLNGKASENYFSVALNLENLQKNTDYGIGVYAYIDLHDGNGARKLSLGNVTFHTYSTLEVKANWSIPDDHNTKIARTLSLELMDTAQDGSRAAYAKNQLTNDGAQVTVTLYSGIGAQRLRIAQKIYNEKADLEALYGNGKVLDENEFGVSSITQDTGYTIVVSSVADQSAALANALGYVNTFDSILYSSETVTPTPTPPDLLTDPSKGVRATPIVNKDAAKYGGMVSRDLPDDCIVGYALEATYLNDQRLAREITYYAFEFDSFYKTVWANVDPVMQAMDSDNAALKKITLNVDQTSDLVPKVALFFGPAQQGDGQYVNGWLVQYGETPSNNGSTLVEGMGRGYRYIFAYTLKYIAGDSNGSSTEKIYPYNVGSTYEKYKDTYGIMRYATGGYFGQKVAYILNSGICEAPAILPDFHTYVARTDLTMMDNRTQASANVEMHFKVRDREYMVDSSNPMIKDTTAVSTPNPQNPSAPRETRLSEMEQLGDGWYKLNITGITVNKDYVTMLTPTANVSEYRLDYSASMKDFRKVGEADDSSCKIGIIPLEFSYGTLFKHASYVPPRLEIKLDYLDENRIEFEFAGSDVIETLKRAAGIQFTFEVQGEGQKITRDVICPLISVDNDSRIYAQIATGELGNQFLNKTISITRADLIYDTGEHGWAFMEEGGAEYLYALQHIEIGSEDQEEGFGAYVSASRTGSIHANRAAMYTRDAFTTKELRDSIGSSAKFDKKYSLGYKKWITGVSSNTYLYPDQYGVDSGSSSQVAMLSGSLVTPKRLDRLPLEFVNDTKTFVLDHIVPTMSKTAFRTSTTNIAVEGLTVYGVPNPGRIYMAAYKTEEDAKNFTDLDVAGFISIDLTEDGRPKESGYPSLINLPQNLENDNYYYITFYYLNANGEKVHLLDRETTDRSIYKVKLSEKVEFTVQKSEYINTTYFDKAYQFLVSLSRSFGITLRYDIYASAQDAKDSEAEPLYSYEELQQNNLLVVTGASVSRNISLKLDPSENRSKLTPGGTYYLKITAVGNTSGETEGETIVPFKIDALPNRGALIYIKKSESLSITWQVTINDLQHSIMGVDGESVGRAGLYAVRFTDAEGKRLRTTYDDKVYDASVARREFILDDNHIIPDTVGETLQQMYEGEKYIMNIYAAYDGQHIGKVNEGDAIKSYTDYFEKTANLEDSGAKFNELVDSFWNADKKPNTEKQAIANSFLLASKTSMTVPPTGFYLDTEKVFADRKNETTIQMMFMESFGLVDINDESLFRYIEWSVNGFTSKDGQIVDVDGVINNLKALKAGTYAGYDMYYMDIPAELPKGNYTIILKIRKNDSATEVFTVTVNSAV